MGCREVSSRDLIPNHHPAIGAAGRDVPASGEMLGRRYALRTLTGAALAHWGLQTRMAGRVHLVLELPAPRLSLLKR